ncbi:MAG: lmo0937 family membrane protein [Sphingomicrobium sp.]
MLMTVAIIILILWLLGAFVVHIGGALIHILLIIGVIVLVMHFVRGRSAV